MASAGADLAVIDLTAESDDESPSFSTHVAPAVQPVIKSEPIEEEVEPLDTTSGAISDQPGEVEAVHKSEADSVATQAEQLHQSQQPTSTQGDLTTTQQLSQPDVVESYTAHGEADHATPNDTSAHDRKHLSPTAHPHEGAVTEMQEDNPADAEDAAQAVLNNDDIMAGEQTLESEMFSNSDHDLPPFEVNSPFMGTFVETAPEGLDGFDPLAFPQNDATAAEHELNAGPPGLSGMDMNALEALRLYNMNNDDFEEAAPDEDAIQPDELEVLDQPQQDDEDGEMLDWNAAIDVDHVIADQENELKKAGFARLRTEFEQKQVEGSITQADEIRFATAESAEQARLRDFERSRIVVEEIPVATNELPPGYEDQDSLFIPETPALPEKQTKKRAVPKPKNRINAQELREAMSAGIDAGYASGRKGKRKAPASAEDKQPRKKREPKAGAAKPGPKARRGKKGPNLSNIRSLGSTNVIRAANENESRPDMPTFTSKAKAKALNELIASIPSAEQRSHSGERKAILEATTKFSGRGSVRSDGKGGWKLKGMKSSLYHHQLLGAAFLRDRERSDSKPHGGMVCDEMGFGKTIQMIANILDGKPAADSPNRTTLIVAPPTLVNQWMEEFVKHIEPEKLGRILCYHAGSRLQSNDVPADLQRYDVILSTYTEVLRSYPLTEPPKHLSSDKAKNEWWKTWYREKAGPLHKVKFLRIVLDEAQAIKSHKSKTSAAVRALAGTYRWAITGTPIMNYIEELYSFFAFLRVPHTGDFATFQHNYCNNRSGREPVDMGRIHNILRAVMLRRTHVDSLFDAPIVKLPGISHNTYPVEFNSVERAIYNMVRRRYIGQINAYSSTGELTANYRNVLAMLTRLRMLCAHIFLCQDVLKQMFVAADIETLWRLTAKEVETSTEEAPRVNILMALRKMLQAKDNTIQTSQTRTADQSVAPTPDPEAEHDIRTGKAFGLTFKFRRFLRTLTESRTWTELHLRSVCAKCRLPPDEPMCTSCFHVYCKECLSAMDFERRERDEEKIACIECGTHFEETSSCSGLKELGFNSEEVAQKVEKVKAKRGKNKTAVSWQGSQTNADEDEEEDPPAPDWIGMDGTVLTSAKLTATKAAILNWHEKNPNEKIIIYTQFLGLCRILGRMCEAEKWGYIHFNGKMTQEARQKSIKRFGDDPHICVMICSLKAGGVGLNLTMASKVIILDLWFNSAIEAQAYCRAFRIGQQNKVEVMRFVVKDSIDEDLVRMQDRKDGEIVGAIGPDSLGKRATIQQLLELFGDVKEGEGQNEFILMEDEGLDDEDDNVDMAERLPPRPF
ncbi:SNF2 family N-terminal domain-containing protein [Exophiala viscosa]|uniref:SNF2 family N-terminal domain-containing protein n=1 Tax=Exophiala viscosa TaxID=2486360 RepID=A0AAN6E312_9EURO|nr:SNF2 family N-terminal domain-containing protein [Exophiala viscosa]